MYIWQVSTAEHNITDRKKPVKNILILVIIACIAQAKITVDL